jgi:hypothetical protein
MTVNRMLTAVDVIGTVEFGSGERRVGTGNLLSDGVW